MRIEIDLNLRFEWCDVFLLQAIKSPPIVNNGKSAVLNKVPNEKLKLHQPKAEEFKANWDEPIKGEL